MTEEQIDSSGIVKTLPLWLDLVTFWAYKAADIVPVAWTVLEAREFTDRLSLFGAMPEGPRSGGRGTLSPTQDQALERFLAEDLISSFGPRKSQPLVAAPNQGSSSALNSQTCSRPHSPNAGARGGPKCESSYPPRSHI